MEQVGLLAVYMVFAWGTMYLIVGPPLERWLQARQPNIMGHDVQRWRDRFVFVWSLVNLIVIASWFYTFRDFWFPKDRNGLFY
jgi:hypothetical protein